MKISFRSIVKSLTGISTPVFGVSWTPSTLEVDIASALLTFFEDRRVLYNPFSIEDPGRVVRSIQEMRERLTLDLERIGRDSELGLLLRGMRSTCRRFLDQTESMLRPSDRYMRLSMMRQEEQFFIALGDFRGRFGIYLAQLCVRYGLDVEPQLAAILPAGEDEDDEPLPDRLVE